jgi:hypothetical protein
MPSNASPQWSNACGESSLFRAAMVIIAVRLDQIEQTGSRLDETCIHWRLSSIPTRIDDDLIRPW